jgi:predicted CXXCH cytochrome family protein
VPHAALTIVAIALTLGTAIHGARAMDPHLDPGVLPDGCAACHRGHGESRSPMLPAAQVDLCLSCHESQTRLEQNSGGGRISLESSSTFLASTLASPFVHPLSDHAYSSREPGVVTCTSCHSPHRGLPRQAGTAANSSMRRQSIKDPNRFEFEMCGDCHGAGGRNQQTRLDVSGLAGQNSRSYHPIQAPAADSSPSVIPALAGREINCTDCHGNSDPSGPRGPHGSAVRYLLRAAYSTVDGSSESSSTYTLCYNCHDRQKVLASTTFSSHRLHIVDLRASCATCHDPHGSSRNRALIRFGDETSPVGVSESIRSGNLAFISNGPGEGACYLTCHGPTQLDRQRTLEPQRSRVPTPAE